MIDDLCDQISAKMLRKPSDDHSISVYVHGSFVDTVDSGLTVPYRDIDLLVICDQLSRALLNLLLNRLQSIRLGKAAFSIEQRVGPLATEAAGVRSSPILHVTIYDKPRYADVSPAVRYLHAVGSVPAIGAALAPPILCEDWRARFKRDVGHLAPQWHDEEVAWWLWRGEHELHAAWSRSPLTSERQRSKFQRHSHALLASWYLLMLESGGEFDGVDDQITALLPHLSETITWPSARRAMLSALPQFN